MAGTGAQGVSQPGQTRGANPPRTVLELLRAAGAFLAERGAPAPRLDAEVLLAQVLGTDRMGLYVQYDKPLQPGELDAYRAAIRRRAAREPVAYITGRKEFMSLEFVVDRRVLIPRPETELLVETVEKELQRRLPPGAALTAADLGTGSGAIAVALACRIPSLTVWACDIDAGALAVAAENAARHGVAQRVICARGDWTAALPADQAGEWHALIANPPYVARAEAPALAEEITRYEPPLAIFAGDDPLVFYRRLAAAAPGLLRPGGFVAVEVGAGQASSVGALFAARGFAPRPIVSDYAGHPRVVWAVWRPAIP